MTNKEFRVQEELGEQTLAAFLGEISIKFNKQVEAYLEGYRKSMANEFSLETPKGKVDATWFTKCIYDELAKKAARFADRVEELHDVYEAIEEEQNQNG